MALFFTEGNCDSTGTKQRGKDGTCICHEKFSGAKCAICAKGYTGDDCNECQTHYYKENEMCLGNLK